MLTALDTGCWMGEILNLEWPDVDTKQGRLTVRKPKSGNTGTIPRTARQRTRLREIRAPRIVPMEGPDWVFAHFSPRWGGKDGRAFKTDAAKIGHPNLRPHDRHQAAVNLVRAGVPLPDVARWLGHSPNSLTVTMRYARHAPGNAAEAALALLEQRIGVVEKRAAQGG